MGIGFMPYVYMNEILGRSYLAPRAFGSLAQHSGDLVFMFLCGLRVTTTGKLEMAELVSRTTTEAHHVAVQPIPEADARARRQTRRQVQRQWPLTWAGYILAQPLLVRRENLNPTAPA